MEKVRANREKTGSTVRKEDEFSTMHTYPENNRHVQNYSFSYIFDLIKKTLRSNGFKLWKNLMINNENLKISILVLVILFIVTSAFVASFSYPLGEQRNLSPASNDIWTGGTIPDEKGYFGWAQIYYETGKTHIPLEEIGPTKIQHVDFFIGDSPEECIFAKVDISEDEPDKTDWEIKARNITVTVFDGNNEGIAGIDIEIREEKKNLHWKGVSGTDGKFIVNDVPPGRYLVDIETQDRPLQIHFATDYQNLNYPIVATANLKSWVHETVEINIHVDHYINPNLKDVDVYLGADWQRKKPIGYTNEQGNYSINLSPGSNMHRVTVVKKTSNIFPPLGSVVVSVDGRYAIANRWPPGYCYLIIPFWLSGMMIFISIFVSAIASVSTYFIAKRLYDQETAIIATILLMVCGLSMVILYARGMADYAAMAFSLMGISLFMESIGNDGEENKTLWKLFLGLLGGLSFAFAVTMRYSTIVILSGVLVYLFMKLVKAMKNSTLESAKENYPPIIAFILGLLIIGFLLAGYNDNLFGGPLNSGYQMSHTVETKDGNTTVETPEETMIEQYFNPSSVALSNIFNRILPQLFLLLPTLFIAPIGFLLDFRRSRTWLLSFWVVPVLIIYMQMSWVGQIPVEDMRYFLPVLPPTAILSAYAMCQIVKRWEARKNQYLVIILSMIALTGFIMAHYGINWQLHRRQLGPIFTPPIIAILFTALVYLLIYGELIYSKALGNSFRCWKKRWVKDKH